MPVSHDSSGETSHNQEFLRVHRTRLKASTPPGGPQNPKVRVQPQTRTETACTRRSVRQADAPWLEVEGKGPMLVRMGNLRTLHTPSAG